MSIKTRRLGSEVPTDGWGEIINSPLSIIHFLNEKVKHTYCRNYSTGADPTIDFYVIRRFANFYYYGVLHCRILRTLVYISLNRSIFQFFRKMDTFHHGGMPTCISQQEKDTLGQYCIGRKRLIH